MPSFLLQYRLHCWQRSYPSMAPRMKSSSAVSWFKGRMMMCRMASMHSGLPKNRLILLVTDLYVSCFVLKLFF